MNPPTHRPWYHAGLSFSCTQCGNCCTGAPGWVFVDREEIEKIAEFIGRTEKWLGPEHLRRVGKRYSLTEDKKNGDCCFLTNAEGKRICSIYPVRPLQCRTWPFWDSNLQSPDDWAEAAEGCPGINTGRNYEYVQIELRRTARTWEDLPA